VSLKCPFETEKGEAFCILSRTKCGPNAGLALYSGSGVRIARSNTPVFVRIRHLADRETTSESDTLKSRPVPGCQRTPEVAVEHVEPVLVLTTEDGATGGIAWSGILKRNVSRHDAKAHIGHEKSSLTHGHAFMSFLEVAQSPTNT
jgi:hypothetical protein